MNWRIAIAGHRVQHRALYEEAAMNETLPPEMIDLIRNILLATSRDSRSLQLYPEPDRVRRMCATDDIPFEDIIAAFVNLAGVYDVSVEMDPGQLNEKLRTRA